MMSTLIFKGSKGSGLNMYWFCSDNPITRVDSDGKADFSVTAKVTYGFNLGTHEKNSFFKAEASAKSNYAELNVGYKREYSSTKWGQSSANFKGVEDSYSAGFMAGYDKIGMAGLSTTIYDSKTSNPAIIKDRLQDTNQRVGTYTVRIGSRDGLNVTGNYYNDMGGKPFIGGGTDKNRTAGGSIKFQSDKLSGSVERLGFGLNLDMVTGETDNNNNLIDEKRLSPLEGANPAGTYIMQGSHKNLSVGAFSLSGNMETSFGNFGGAVGLDSEGIRGSFQNELVHRNAAPVIPDVPLVDKPDCLYFQTSFGEKIK